MQRRTFSKRELSPPWRSCTKAVVLIICVLVAITTSASVEEVRAPGDAWITLNPTSIRVGVHPGDSFTITVSVSNVDLMDAWQVFLKYDSMIVSLTGLWIPLDNVFGDPHVVKQISTGPDYGREWFLYGMDYISFGNALYVGNVSVTEGILFKIECTALIEGSTSIMIATRDNPVAVAEAAPHRFSTLLLYDELSQSEQEIAQPLRVQNAALTISQTITIEADGSIEPQTALMQRDGDLYTLTGNVTSSTDGIVVERDNIVIDGSGYAVQGVGAFTSSLYGLYLNGRSNVTVRNIKIRNFDYGIWLNSSSNNSIDENRITNNWNGILLRYSSNNTIHGNIITNSSEGIWLTHFSEHNSIYGNNITDSLYDGILLDSSSNNSIYHNNFINNTWQVYCMFAPVSNYWDDAFPSGGNYWSDYVQKYPNASEMGASGIWNTPYAIDANNTDRYPLIQIIPEFPLRIVFPLFMIFVLMTTALGKKRQKSRHM